MIHENKQSTGENRIPQEAGEGRERSRPRDREGHFKREHREQKEQQRRQHREPSPRKETIEQAVHHYKAVAIGILVASCAIGVPLGLYYGIAYLNAGASWSPFYRAPAEPAAPVATPPAPEPFEHPDFTDGSVTLLPQNMWIRTYFQRSDTLAWVSTYEGAASGIPDTAVVPPVGAAYTYVDGFMFFGGADSGSLTTGAFGDGVARAYYMSGCQITSTGHLVVPCAEYRNTAASIVVRSITNNTAYTFAANHPLKATNADASNLSISIFPSQAEVDALSKWTNYYDRVNASSTGTWIVYTGNWTTAAIGNTYLDVYANGIKLTPTAVTGSTNLNYMLPFPLTQSPVTINSYWTDAAITANAGMTAVPTVKCAASGLTPGTGATP